MLTPVRVAGNRLHCTVLVLIRSGHAAVTPAAGSCRRRRRRTCGRRVGRKQRPGSNVDGRTFESWAHVSNPIPLTISLPAHPRRPAAPTSRHTMKWVALPGDGDAPAPRSSHSITAVGDILYVWGGEHAPRVPQGDKMVAYSLSERRWTKLEVRRAPMAAPSGPRPRLGPPAFPHPDSPPPLPAHTHTHSRTDKRRSALSAHRAQRRCRGWGDLLLWRAQRPRNWRGKPERLVSEGGSACVGGDSALVDRHAATV